MARPAKPAAHQSGNLGKEELQLRQDAEDSICEKKSAVGRPTMKLNAAQKKIRRKIVDELGDTLRNTDRFVLDQAAIAIYRLQQLEIEVNEHPELIFRKGFIGIKKEYFSEFARLCNELSLSPQARAKLANAQTATKANPLARLLSGDDEDEPEDDAD